MVANFRCTEIKNEAIESVNSLINELKVNAEKAIIVNFLEKCTTIVKTAQEYFDSNANQYQGAVFMKVHDELQEQLYQSLYLSFSAQLKIIKQQVFDKFDISIRNINKKDSVNDIFITQTNQMLKAMLHEFEETSKKLILEGSAWAN